MVPHYTDGIRSVDWFVSELAEGRARDKIPEMQKSLQGRISEHQQKMLKHQLGHIESLTALIMDLDADIKKKQNP